ncbi:MAG TPA: PIN domain-containing protein [Steroidobacteraceae bacterium]|nr:PIN domain-containing protein [Steroidobacteraceae bacterium]
MAAREAFVDTSALYALIDRRDSHHPAMVERVQRLLHSRRTLVTTDYVVCESVNLANARAGHQVGARILELIERSAALRVEWIGSLRFESTKVFYRRYSDSDHRLSFTDCASFVVMRELRISEALTTDEHFVEAGFKVLA